jgi:hypothetical protein
MNFIPCDHLHNSRLLDKIAQDAEGTLEATREVAPDDILPYIKSALADLSLLTVPNISSSNRFTLTESQLSAGKLAIAMLPRHQQFLVDSSMCGLHQQQIKPAKLALEHLPGDNVTLYNINDELKRTKVMDAGRGLGRVMAYNTAAFVSSSFFCSEKYKFVSRGRPFIIGPTGRKGKHDMYDGTLIHELFHIRQLLERPILIPPNNVDIEKCRAATHCQNEIEAYTKEDQIMSLALDTKYSSNSMIELYKNILARIGSSCLSII